MWHGSFWQAQSKPACISFLSSPPLSTVPLRSPPFYWPAASIDELLGYANARADLEGPDAFLAPSTTFGITGDFTMFEDSNDPFSTTTFTN